MKKVIELTIFIFVVLGISTSGICQNQVLIGTEKYNVCDYFVTDSTFKYYVDTNLVKGLNDGRWCVLYDDSVRINLVFNIKRGKLNGKYTSFNPSGKYIVVSNYCNNLRDGFSVRYIKGKKDLRLQDLVFFDNGKLAGIQYVFNDREKVKMTLLWKNGTMLSMKKYFVPKKASMLVLFFKYIDILPSRICKGYW